MLPYSIPVVRYKAKISAPGWAGNLWPMPLPTAHHFRSPAMWPRARRGERRSAKASPFILLDIEAMTAPTAPYVVASAFR
jgi:hypothetical protein